MSRYCKDVQDFQTKFGFDTPSEFIFIPQDLQDFRVKFFYEEYGEYRTSYEANDLGTAVDSLIDLVYITCGTAIYHGIDHTKFDGILLIPHRGRLFDVKLTQTGVPHFLSPSQHSIFCDMIEANIISYIDACANKSETMVKDALASIYLNCVFASTEMDLTNEQWDEMWNDVQRANMSKERALRAEDSKRGSTYDIVKPAGWIPPRTEELIQKYLAGE